MPPLLNRRIRAAASAPLLALAVMSCASWKTHRADDRAEIERIEGTLSLSQPAVARRILVSGNPPSPPRGCDVIMTVRRIEAFFIAVNSRDTGIVPRFFPVDQPETFHLYRLAGPGQPPGAIDDVGSLVEHFQLRYRQNERLELHAIQVNRWDGGLAHFGPVIASRTALDLPGGSHRMIGKGALDCRSGKFVVLNLSAATEANPAPPYR